MALVLAMLLLRREVFAVTHAPPLMDLFPDSARRASYQTILSVAYALLAQLYLKTGRLRLLQAAERKITSWDFD